MRFIRIGYEFILPAVKPRTQLKGLRPLLTLLPLPLAGCDPIFDVAGAYFPAWLICILLGGIITLIIRDVLIRFGLHAHLGWTAIAYLGLFSMAGCSIWLIFFTT